MLYDSVFSGIGILKYRNRLLNIGKTKRDVQKGSDVVIKVHIEFDGIAIYA